MTELIVDNFAGGGGASTGRDSGHGKRRNSSEDGRVSCRELLREEKI